MGTWLERGYRRCLVDMHIEDWSDEFFSEFDPEVYIDTIAKAKVQGVMIYAHSHVGLCNWPSEHGEMHRGLRGRDIVRGTFEAARRRGMDVILYYSIIYDNWAYEKHPDWSIRNSKGERSRESNNWHGKRYGWCCPNNEEYRKYTVDQVEDLCSHYEFDGWFFDMLFWPEVCYCDTCRRKFKQRTNRDIPEIVDWNDPLWIEFQRAREEWLAEYGKLATDAVRRLKPDVDVTHNWGNMMQFWRFGTSDLVTDASTYGSGDFYHGTTEGSFTCKYLYNTIGPFEYLTSRCTGLEDHTTSKPIGEIEANAFIALANKGAFMFIDAIDPVGTLNPAVYEMLGEVNAKVETYEPYIGGTMRQEAAVYVSLTSKMNPKDEVQHVADGKFSNKVPHLMAAINATRMLKEKHIPYGVISVRNLEQLSRFSLIILPDAAFLEQEEVTALRQYVYNGGKLYASGGKAAQYFGDLLGLTYVSETKEHVTYAAPLGRGKGLMNGFTSRHPLAVRGPQAIVTAATGVEVLATITLPYTDPDAPEFSSIHSNPPGIATEHPSLTVAEFGKGEAVWSAGIIEKVQTHSHLDVLEAIVRMLHPQPFSFSANAHKAVEVTVFDQEDHNRIIVNLVNTMEIYPQLPVRDIVVEVDLKGRLPESVRSVPDNGALNYRLVDGRLIASIPEVATFAMIEVALKSS